MGSFRNAKGTLLRYRVVDYAPSPYSLRRLAKPKPQPCWHCRHFLALEEGGGAVCLHPPHPHMRPHADEGCAMWVRDPGADDEPGYPPVAIRIDWPPATD